MGSQSQHFSGLQTRRATGVSPSRNRSRETPHAVLAFPGPREHAAAQHRSQEQLLSSCSLQQILQMLLEAAYSQLKFISGLFVCLLNNRQPTDSHRQPRPVWELLEPCLHLQPPRFPS